MCEGGRDGDGEGGGAGVTAEEGLCAVGTVHRGPCRTTDSEGLAAVHVGWCALGGSQGGGVCGWWWMEWEVG